MNPGLVNLVVSLPVYPFGHNLADGMDKASPLPLPIGRWLATMKTLLRVAVSGPFGLVSLVIDVRNPVHVGQ